MTSRFKVEQLLMVGVLFAFLVPLNTNIGPFKIVTWNIPALALLFWISLRGINRQRFRLSNFDLWDYSILGISFIYLIMTLIGYDPIANLMFLNSWLFCLLLAFYFRRTYGKVLTPQMLIVFAFISVGIESIIGITQQITSSEIGNISVYFGQTPETTALRSIGDTDMGRVHGTLGTGNLVGSWICMFTPFIIYSSSYFKNRKLSIGISTMVLISIITILLTISRFNIALFVCVLGFSLYHYYRNKISTRIRLKLKIASFLFVATLISIAAITTIKYWKEIGLMREAIEFRFSDTFEEANKEGLGSSGLAARMEMNKGALQAFLRSPIIGVGFKNSRWIWPTVDAYVPKGWVFQPHNLYMIMLVEGGIFLFIFYVMFTLLPFYRMWQLRRVNDPLLIAFFLSLSSAMGIQMIYITFTSPTFTAVYMMMQGCAMGYMDQYLKNEEPSEKHAITP
ncbi:MAG: O-antigen ligase family protein [Candidatus Marinimicrobia bacterium]|nr:O-antigen ligase family protein [Candidatus Neomarinimicrobiota bacterium]